MSASDRSPLSHRYSTLVTVGTLALLTGLVLWPLFVYGPPLTRDGLNHVYRLSELVWHVQHGDWYPRWFSNLHFGFGAPVLNFYAPLSYYVMLPVVLLSGSLAMALSAGFVFAIALLVSGTYLWLRDQFDSEWAGLTGAAAMGFTPVIYTNSIFLGALPPVLAIGFMVWLFWAVLRVVRNPTRQNRALLVGFLLAATLSHNLQILFFAIPLLVYGLTLVVLRWRTHRGEAQTALLSLVVGVLISGLLASFQLVPFALEQRYVGLDNSVNYDVRDSLMSAAELFSWQPPFDPTRIQPANMWRLPALPWPQTLAGILALVLTAFWPGKLRSEQRAIIALFAGLAGLYLFMVGDWSQPVWDAISALSIVQFSSRLMQPIGLFFAVLVAGGVARIPTGDWRLPTAVVGIIAAIFLYAIPFTYRVPYEETVSTVLPANTYAYERSHPEGVGTTSTLEFAPTTVELMPDPATLADRFQASAFPSRLDTLPAGVNLLSEETHVNRFLYEVESDSAFDLKLFQFAFPGWQATVDGQAVTLATVAPHGTLSLRVPPGRHVVEVARVATGAQVLGMVCMLLGALWMAVWLWRAPPLDNPATAYPLTRARAVPAYWLLIPVLLWGLRVGIEAVPCTPLKCSVLTEMTSPTPIVLDGALELIGTDLYPTPTVVAGEPLALRLFFRASTPLNGQYQARLSLLNADGIVFSAFDVYEPGNVLMQNWPVGHTAVAEVALPIAPDVPPGAYTVAMLVYPLVDGQAGPPVGASVPVLRSDVGVVLGQIAVSPPRPSPVNDFGIAAVTWPDQAYWPGDSVPIWVTWRAGATSLPDFDVVLSVDTADGTVELGRFAPAGSSYPPSAWLPNTSVKYLYLVRLLRTLPGGDYPLILSLSPAPSLASQSLGTLTVTAVEPVFSQPSVAVPLAYPIGDALELVGFQSAAEGLTTHWRVLRVIDRPLTFFVHQLSPIGEYLAGADAPPPRPATSWQPGEYITLHHSLAPGDHFRIGVYDSETLQPLGLPYESP